MDWNVPTWDAPEAVKVIVIGVGITLGLAISITAIVSFFMWIASVSSPDTAAITAVFLLFSGVISGITALVRNG